MPQVENTPARRVFYGLWVFYHARAEHQTARELAAQLLTLAHRVQDPALLLVAHCGLAQTVYCLGELAHARTLFEQGLAFYNPSQHRALAPLYGTDPTVTGLSWLAWDLWLLGYPDQAEQKCGRPWSWHMSQTHLHAGECAVLGCPPPDSRDAQATHALWRYGVLDRTGSALPCGAVHDQSRLALRCNAGEQRPPAGGPAGDGSGDKLAILAELAG